MQDTLESEMELLIPCQKNFCDFTIWLGTDTIYKSNSESTDAALPDLQCHGTT